MGNVGDLPVQIIELSIRKWQDYRDLRLAALRESPQAFGSKYEEQVDKPDEYWKSRLEEAAKGTSRWLLFARQGHKLIGMIGAFRDENNGLEAEIISMYVIPDARGKGIASLMMRGILMVLKDNGICVVRLGVNLDQPAAVHIYQKFGFEIKSVEQGLMGDGLEYDVARMEKQIEL
jgi:ribosomal protein S18 acetylase RimI-like enzyme